MFGGWLPLPCITSAWSPRIGDPGVLGWLTVAVYGVTILLCILAALRSVEREQRVFCALLALVLFPLMINKQLDLQTGLTEVARCLAHAQGWYEMRGVVKLWFVAIFGTGLLAAVFLAFRALMPRMARVWPGFLGVACLAGFVLLRAAEIHAFSFDLNDLLYKYGINVALEFGGIALVAAHAIRVLRRPGGQAARSA